MRNTKKKDSCWLEYTTKEKKKSEDFRFDPEIYGISKDIMELLSLLFLSDREFKQILLILEKMHVREMCTFVQGAFLARKKESWII